MQDLRHAQRHRGLAGAGVAGEAHVQAGRWRPGPGCRRSGRSPAARRCRGCAASPAPGRPGRGRARPSPLRPGSGQHLADGAGAGRRRCRIGGCRWRGAGAAPQQPPRCRGWRTAARSCRPACGAGAASSRASVDHRPSSRAGRRCALPATKVSAPGVGHAMRMLSTLMPPSTCRRMSHGAAGVDQHARLLDLAQAVDEALRRRTPRVDAHDTAPGRPGRSPTPARPAASAGLKARPAWQPHGAISCSVRSTCAPASG
jgi:hypothetical protein